jgi:hypothetical protein
VQKTKKLIFLLHELERKLLIFSLFKKNKQKLLLFVNKALEAPSIDKTEKQSLLRQRKAQIVKRQKKIISWIEKVMSYNE